MVLSTTYADVGLGAGTYRYRIQSRDSVGNLSAVSNLASADVPDTQAPTPPAGLSATSVAYEVHLTWVASTDDVAVTGYLLERCTGVGCSTFDMIATPGAASYSDTLLSTNTSYTYRVRATDVAGNRSAYSDVASATTDRGIEYVQGNDAIPQTPQTSVSVTYNAAQTAGNLNVVVVGWNDSTSTVSTVTDTTGNLYEVAVGPTVLTGSASQSIYYSKNISSALAGANTVTVTFAGAADFADIRILEYDGADPVNPVDVTAAASGTGVLSDSGSVVTTYASDLIFGANLVEATSEVGLGFHVRLSTLDGDIAQDRMVGKVGSYAATAPVGLGFWIMQMVAFRMAPDGDSLPPTSPAALIATPASPNQINLTWTPSTDNVGVTGYRIERCQGAGCSGFAQIGTSSSSTTFAMRR